MKIVIDARESGTSTGRYIDKLIENLQQIDKINEYVVIYKNDRIDKVGALAANFKKVPTKYQEFTFGEQLGFARQLRKLKADLVHFGMIQQPLLYTKKSVTTMHDLTTVRFRNPTKSTLWYLSKLPFYWLVIQVVVRRARAIITASDYVLKDLKKFTRHPFMNIHVVYESADAIKDYPEAVEELEGKKFIMYVGRHTPHKNLPRLIRAHQELLKNHPDLILAIAGKKDKATDSLINSFEKKPQNIVFTGFVSEGQLRWMYENTACYVFPSLSEGFGLPGLEAMRHGAPVASSNATCLPEIYGNAAVYFSPYSVLEMAEVINDVLTHKKLRQDLIAKGKRQVSKYSWKRMAEQTRNIYNSVLESKLS